MGNIYRRADWVVVWLGLASSSSLMGMETLSQSRRQVQFDIEARRMLTAEGVEPDETWAQSAFAISNCANRWHGVSNIICRDWFKRI